MGLLIYKLRLYRMFVSKMLDLYTAFCSTFPNLQIVYLNKSKNLLITKKYFWKDLIDFHAKN